MKRVAIVGGGLAGMTAALRLAERGCKVTLYEASERLGGKAGSDLVDGQWEDHGYHMFPAFYLNTWAVIDQLGIRDRFRDLDAYHHLFAGEFPRFRPQRNVASLAALAANLRSGIVPAREQLLFFYSVLDLMGEDLHRGGLLDDVTVIGFLRSRFYRTEAVANELHQIFLKGAAIAGHHMSARVLQQAMGYWAAHPHPVASVARASLQEVFIEPFQRKLVQLGVDIHLGQTLTRVELGEHKRISALRMQSAETSPTVSNFDAVVLAIPPDRLPAVLDDDLCRQAPSLANVHKLRWAPMAVLHVYLRGRYPGIPRDTGNLVDSRFGLTFFDVSQTWPGMNRTVLQFVAGDSWALVPLSDGEARRQLLEEIDRYLPGLPAMVEHSYYRSHTDQPIFVNDVGCARYQPRATTEIRNLFAAGEHCRSFYGLAGMENAVITGLEAAEAARQSLELDAPAVPVARVKQLPRWKIRAAKVLLTPAAAMSKLATRAQAWKGWSASAE